MLIFMPDAVVETWKLVEEDDDWLDEDDDWLDEDDEQSLLLENVNGPQPDDPLEQLDRQLELAVLIKLLAVDFETPENSICTLRARRNEVRYCGILYNSLLLAAERNFFSDIGPGETL